MPRMLKVHFYKNFSKTTPRTSTKGVESTNEILQTDEINGLSSLGSQFYRGPPGDYYSF